MAEASDSTTKSAARPAAKPAAFQIPTSNPPEATLLLVDGSSYLYRAFHALPDLRNGEGQPTGALYGMINMMRKLRQDVPVKYIACVFDARGKTFRDDIYPDYKGHRPSMPEDLAAQIEPIHRAVAALGWPVVSVEGVEADDVIGTLAARARAEGIHTVVSTGDKDLAQLVNERVTLVNTMSNEMLDPPGVLAKFGVPPERILDYLTLIGDAVDNVPGVEKVGPKTAVKWLSEYGSLAGVVENAANIKGVAGDNLRKALDWLPTGQKLLTVVTDCTLEPHVDGWPSLEGRAEDKAELAELYRRYGFKTWLRDLTGEQINSSPRGAAAGQEQSGLFDAPTLQPDLDQPKIERRYDTVLTETQLDTWLSIVDTAGLVCFDTETTSLEPLLARIVGLSFSVEAGKACYIPLAHQGPGVQDQLDREMVLAKFKPWLENPAKRKVGQNLKYDAHVLANHGIFMRGIAHDTLLQSYVLESHRSHDMDSMAQRHLNETTIKFEDVCGKGASQIGFDQVDIERATEYSAEDADITLRLHEFLWPQIDKAEGLRKVYADIELPVSTVLFKIERNGVLIDAGRLARQSAELGARLMELEKQAYELAGQPFNLNSPKQLGEILFVQQKLPVVKKTASGAPSTDEEVLQKLAEDYPLPKLLLDYRGLAKLKSTYTDKLPKMVNAETGRVHTNYAQAVAVTGRLASNDPNLQNIPVRTEEGRRIREAFIAPEGSFIVSADYSQIELRIMAHLSDDPGLLKAFAAGEDIHRATAAEVFGVALDAVSSEQRRFAKVINFGLIYGMSAFGLASNLGIERSAAQSYIDTYFARYPGVARYMENTRAAARANGHVETVFGRRLWLPEINSPNGPRRQGAERAAINAPMQGTAADLIKLAMIAVQGWLETDGLRSKLIMQVHDELVLEVPQAELELLKRRLPELMSLVAQLKVPLVAEVGAGVNWEEAH
ncbi:MAG: DNA polymerase I [Candidatus Protistobacter heckmanni]|nr:DNA polymerase I [Candidatus Protistobacter heckmanni]